MSIDFVIGKVAIVEMMDDSLCVEINLRRKHRYVSVSAIWFFDRLAEIGVSAVEAKKHLGRRGPHAVTPSLVRWVQGVHRRAERHPDPERGAALRVTTGKLLDALRWARRTYRRPAVET